MIYLILFIWVTNFSDVQVMKLTKHVIPKQTKDRILQSDSYAEMYRRFTQEYDDIDDEEEDDEVVNMLRSRYGVSRSTMKRIKEKKKQRAFIENVKAIKQHNKDYYAGLTSYKMEVNSFTIMDEDEVDKKFTGINITEEMEENQLSWSDDFFARPRYSDGYFDDSGYSEGSSFFDNPGYFDGSNQLGLKSGGLPKSFDWRDKGAVTRAKNQKRCQSCWAFSVLPGLEAVYYKITGKLVDLSAKEIRDCAYADKPGRKHCDTGWMIRPLNGIMETKHLAFEKDLRYNTAKSTCKKNLKLPNAIGKVFEITQVVNLGREGESKMLNALVENMPLAVVVVAVKGFVQAGEGIFDGKDPKCQNSPNHAITLIGYAENYYIIKNSWGPDWAEDGTARLARQRGRDICKLQSVAVYFKYKNVYTGKKMDNEEKDFAPDIPDFPPDIPDFPSPNKESNGCSDMLSQNDCETLKEFGYCGKSERMKRDCPRTCNMCPDVKGAFKPDEGSDDCKDRLEEHTCMELKDFGYCTKAEAMKTDCPKTCNLCLGSVARPTTNDMEAISSPDLCTDKLMTDVCRSLKEFGYCETTPDIRADCLLSCGACSESSSSEGGYDYKAGCSDEIPVKSCILLQSEGACSISSVRYDCPKTCGVCN